MTGAHEVDIEVEPAVLPGTRSFVADMDVASRFVTPRRCLMRAPLTDAVASSAGTAPVGMLMTLVDVGASDPALAACLPDWTVTQDLSVHGPAGCARARSWSTTTWCGWARRWSSWRPTSTTVTGCRTSTIWRRPSTGSPPVQDTPTTRPSPPVRC